MDNKLKIFKSVAHHSSFTKAAEQLFISQPAISKAIRNLEDEYNTTFFIRNRNSIELTEDGKSFLVYVKRILDVYEEIENQFIHKDNQLPDIITFGASTTLASYIIPKIIAKFRTQYPKTSFQIESDNSEHIENLILNQQLNFGVTEGKNSNPKLSFKKLIKDEIVLVTSAKNNKINKENISLKKLQEIQIIKRESGSGTREIIQETLQKHNINSLNIAVTLNSTEAIKNYLYYSDAYALLSIHAVREDLINNKLKIIDVKGFSVERWFYFVSRTGYKSNMMDYFEKFILKNYNF
ncbi:LysR family transcriptional regulator [Cellulophaga sp. HaHaR_3_176]|uniref:LysR family transcriptional regulator n=1 Tax=Cellulophaga sp. HaHaR_3_176 TaxID=1942464 RepID=UPI001C1FE156|nr:LysR family transcriptional regulator [Cellulophaga sp. HaHaR_3_176]QWX85327.1 LysR family transcriptional regulator [Cellulophaga sp. HaHaR_3_176]